MKNLRSELENSLKDRILFLDGAMGTMIQKENLPGTAFSLENLKDTWGREVFDQAALKLKGRDPASLDTRGNNDILSLTRPGTIRGIHRAMLAAGADIIETNTFNSTGASQSDYGTQSLVYELNFYSAKLARKTVDDFVNSRDNDKPGRRRYVAGVLGPTSRTLSLSPDVNNPGFRNISFDELAADYTLAAGALLDGGADLFLVETVFDTLNAKAALFALMTLMETRGKDIPLMISGTITDASGRTLSGQTPGAFWHSVRHARPLSVGLNCALGAGQLKPHVEELAGLADLYVSVHPNAGLPNEFGGYDDSPDFMASVLSEFAREGLVNIVGGCCGTTPEHISAIVRALADLPPGKFLPKGPSGAFPGLRLWKLPPKACLSTSGSGPT